MVSREATSARQNGRAGNTHEKDDYFMKKKPYKSEKFLNKKDSSSTGSICIYDGESPYNRDTRWAFVEISDCNNKVRLHKHEKESDIAWRNKLKSLVAEIEKYIITLK